MALLAFETDPIRRTGPRSWHGSIHDAAFVVFAVALLLALLALWRRHARLTFAIAVVCAACLILPGFAYYLFLAAALAWIEATALKLRSSG
jgi:CHASE2 domain-containing sensor protein